MAGDGTPARRVRHVVAHQRLGLVVISSVVLCTLFGWDDGGPFAAALFGAVAIVNASLALIAFGARATQKTRP